MRTVGARRSSFRGMGAPVVEGLPRDGAKLRAGSTVTSMETRSGRAPAAADGEVQALYKPAPRNPFARCDGQDVRAEKKRPRELRWIPRQARAHGVPWAHGLLRLPGPP